MTDKPNTEAPEPPEPPEAPIQLGSAEAFTWQSGWLSGWEDGYAAGAAAERERMAAPNQAAGLSAYGRSQLGLNPYPQQVAAPSAAARAEPTRLLRKPVKSILELGPCHCPPNTCQAPIIMGRQTPCLRNVASPPAAEPGAVAPRSIESYREEVLAAYKAAKGADIREASPLVVAIKHLRNATRMTLIEAKDQVERWLQDKASPGICLPHGVMFDAFGEPRTRYVRVTLDGAHCVMHPSEGDTYLSDAQQNGDESHYIVSDVYLSEREFEDLPEFDGF